MMDRRADSRGETSLSSQHVGDLPRDAAPVRTVPLARLASVVAGYAVFTVAASAVALVLVPVIRLSSRGREQSELRVQRLLHRGLRLYLAFVERAGIARFCCDDSSALAAPGTLVVANHPTLLDVLVLMRFMPQVDCVVKQKYFDSPLLGHLSRAAGHIPNTGGEAVVEACAERLRRGRSVLIFPEGTRSPVGGFAPFQRGAAHIGLRSGHDLLPVTVRCSPPLLARGEPWWRAAEREFTFTLEVGNPIATEKIAALEPTRGRAARALTRAILEHFEARFGGA